jgi:two-component system NtrC family sensor kinase
MRKSASLAELPTGHARQMEAIGQLAAGIAHEINTPAQYVSDNAAFLLESWAQIAPILALAALADAELRCGSVSVATADAMASSLAAADIDYFVEEFPRAIGETLEGARQIGRIVSAMNEFAHTPNTTKSACDLNHTIESTITVARNTWKYVARMETSFDPAMPPVFCLVDQINQMLLNLIVNAAHAVGEAIGDGSGGLGTIRVGTEYADGWALITISDTGSGIPESIRTRVFEPFFTTKPPGKGTGQGLAIAQSVVLQHGGTIRFESEVGIGTKFLLRLPVTTEDGH